MKSTRLLSPLLLAIVSLLFTNAQAFSKLNVDFPVVRKVVVPTFPEGARDARASGFARVSLTLSPKGEVVSARFKDGNRLFSSICERAASKWLFEPTQSDREQEIEIVFVFTLLPNDSGADEEVVVFTLPNRIEVKRRPPIVKQMDSN